MRKLNRILIGAMVIIMVEINAVAEEPFIFTRQTFNKCEPIFKEYKIYPELKSINGWKRVIKKEMLYQYLNKELKQDDIEMMHKCLFKYGFNISLYGRGL